MFRFSLASFLFFAVVVSVAAAALARATEPWRDITVTMTVVVLMVAALAGMLWHKEARAFAAGFAFSGWAYFVLVFIADLGMRDELLTQELIAWAYSAAHEEEEEPHTGRFMFGVGVNSDAGITGAIQVEGPNDGNVRFFSLPEGGARAYFYDIAHAILALLIAAIGGVVGRMLYAIDEPRPQG